MMRFFSIFSLIILLSSCKDKYVHKYTKYVPVYMSLEEFKNAIHFSSAKEISSHGSIYIKDNYLFVVEPNIGIHFIDNSNPSTPNKIGFLNVPGCSNIAIRGTVLYASSLMDLVCIDISAIHAPTVIQRMENVFPSATAVKMFNYPSEAIDQSKGLVVAWNEVEVEEESSVNDYNGGFGIQNGETATFNSTSTTGVNSGVSGSISKFAIINETLFAYDSGELKTIDISHSFNAQLVATQSVSFNVETLFPYKNFLYMGTTTGMLIYDYSSGTSLNFMTVMPHVWSNDPVVVDDQFAWVTLRGNTNELQLIDINDKANPFLKKTWKLTEPHGLGLDEHTLFVCDGKSGLRVYDVQDATNNHINQIDRIRGVDAYDVIPNNGVLILITKNELLQFDYSNPSKLTQLSSIQIN